MLYSKTAIIKKIKKINKEGYPVKNLREVIKELKREGYLIIRNDFNIKED